MPSFTRMKRPFLEGLLWLYLIQFGHMVLSLEPGYLDFDNLPETNFTCVGKVIGGYYADLETNCQMFHVCTIGQLDEPMDIRFLCLNGTVFDQETRVCERIDEVDCTKSEQFYSLNLELYGNSGPILEESIDPAQETEPPSLIIKSTTPFTLSPTTTKKPIKIMNTPFFSTTRTPSSTTPRTTSKPKVISTHHFPVNPDIRFNPEEINISLNANAPPDIRTKHFLSQSYSDGDKAAVNSASDAHIKPQVGPSTSPKTIYTLDISENRDSDVDFGYREDEVHTEPTRKPQQQFLIETNSFRHTQSFPPSEEYRNSQQFHSSTPRIFVQTTKAPTVHQHHHYTLHSHTEKPPQRVQIPIPLLPTLPPLIFSSPAPFTLQRHLGSKRFAKEHQTPPRIIISASASVSDASGRRLNYSLGTIDAAQILQSPPSSYDEYKESDVVLDPFYHDVPKVKQNNRKKRSTEEKKLSPFDIIKNEKEAVEVLKFLFTWYQSHQATATVPSVTVPVAPDLIHEINYNLSPKNDFETSSSEVSSSTESIKVDVNQLLTKNSRFSVVGGYKNIGRNLRKKPRKPTLNSNIDDTDKSKDIPILIKKIDNINSTVIKDTKESLFNPDDYVDDNYEGSLYKEPHYKQNKENESQHEENQEGSNQKEYITKNNDKSVIDLHTISQFYKYFDIDNNPSTSDKDESRISTSSTESINITSLDESSTNSPASDDIKELFTEVTESDDSTTTLFSTTTSTTTTTASPLKQVNRRRGRGRQKPSNAASSIREPIKSNSQYLNRQGRKRGRSRFTDYTTTSSSTTPPQELHTETAIPETTYTTEIPTMETQNTPNNLEEVSVPNTTPIVIKHHEESSSERTDESSSHQTASVTTSTSSVNEEPINLSTFTEMASTTLPTRTTTENFMSKLFKFFTESRKPKSRKTTTEATREYYEPATENYISTTTETLALTPLDHSDLPTLRDISETTYSKEGERVVKDHNIEENDQKEGGSGEIRSNLLYKLHLIDENLSEKSIITSTEPTPADTSATTPYLSYEVPEHFGTTSSAATVPTVPIEYHPEGKLTVFYHASTESGIQYEKDSDNDIFIVPEMTERNPIKYPLHHTDRHEFRQEQENTTQTTESISEQIVNNDNVTSTTPLVEIEKSISIPISILQSTFDIAHEINNAQSEETPPPNAFMTTEKLEEFIEEVEVTTKSVVAKEDHVRYTSTESYGRTVTEPIPITHLTTEHSILDGGVLGSLFKGGLARYPSTESYERVKENIPTTLLTTENYGRTVTETIQTTERGVVDDEVAKGDLIQDTSTGNYGRTVTETIPTTLLTTEQEVVNVEVTGRVSEVHHNSTEILFIKNTDFGRTETESTTASSPETIEIHAPPVKINSSHLLQVMVETTASTSGEVTSSSTTTIKSPLSNRRTKPGRRRPYGNARNYLGRHRFSTELSTNKPELSEKDAKQDSLTPLNSVENTTDAPLYRSATPTKSELKKLSLYTTPLSSKSIRRFPTKVTRNYVFNCFGKEMNKFYADPRDCRLFHYCTKGYSKNQLLDLKYVCDRKTFFDDEKLICTKNKPERCL